MSLIPPQAPYASRKAVDSGTRGRHEDYLRIVRGTINTTTPSITHGIGFSLTKNGTGDVTITFSPAFSAPPTATATPGDGAAAFSIRHEVAATAAAIRLQLFDTGGLGDQDGSIHFVAVGPV